MQNTNARNNFLAMTLKISVLALLVILIITIFPRSTSSFSYRFTEGQVWEYEDIIAPFNFPIYKTGEQLRNEQQEVLKQFAPYYIVDNKVGEKQLQSILEAAAERHLSEETKEYLNQQVSSIYKQGILSLADMEELQQEGFTRITIVQARVASAYPLDYCYTPKSAYDILFASAPIASQQDVKMLELNSFLLPNLTLDKQTSNNMREALLSEVAPTQGIVMEGERIVSRGDVVSAEQVRKLHSYQMALEQRGEDNGSELLGHIGTATLIFSFVVLLVLYLFVFRPRLFEDINTMLFFSILVCIIIAIACAVVNYTSLSIYLVPFAWVPVIIRVFYDSRTALYVHLITIMICSLLAPAPFEFLILQIAAGMVAVGSLRDMAQRSQLVQTAAWILFTYSLGYTAFTLAVSANFAVLRWEMYIYFVANALLIVFAYGLIYLFEKSFHLLSSITLVELTNINSELMLEFAEKAPGTFQHSLQVSNLAMEAAKSIGANTLLVRTGALYHDIGKLASPHNFTENQQDGVNPLAGMDTITAAKTVMSHVTAGIDMSEKLHLPEIVREFIRRHHGTSRTTYFYNTYRNEHPGEPVDESLFRYPGPKPNSKETAVLMMADAVEARSRSLESFTEEDVTQMVDKMIDAQMADGQLEDTPLTFRDLYTIKGAFVRKLISMNHHRIAYPDLKK